MKKNIIITLLSIIFGTLTASADIVKGRVVDSETKEPLPEAQMTFKQSYGDNGMLSRSFKSDSLGCFTFYADGHGTLTVEMLGYYKNLGRLRHLEILEEQSLPHTGIRRYPEQRGQPLEPAVSLPADNVME